MAVIFAGGGLELGSLFLPPRLNNDIFAGGGLELGSLFRLPRVK